MAEKMTQEELMQLLDKLYEQTVQGISKVTPPIHVLANDYLRKHKDVETAAKSFIRYQITKCTTSGFVTGLGGLITIPVAVPVNVGSVLYVQMRMIACLAYMGGYELDSDQVQTMVYACLAGVTIDKILKKAGIELGEKLAMGLIKKIPKAVVGKINQKVGFRLISRFSTKGLISLGKMVPIVGGVIGGGFDFAETSIIADRAYKMFICGDLDVLSAKQEQEDEEFEVIEVQEVTEEV